MPDPTGFGFRARAIFGVERSSASVAWGAKWFCGVFGPDKGEPAAESLHGVFWHSYLPTSSALMRMPVPTQELVNAIIDAMAAHERMSRQALNSAKVQEGLRDVLLGPGQLYEELRKSAE